jgi:hypothetical protein
MAVRTLGIARGAALALAAGLLAGCTPGGQPAGTATVTEDYTVAGGTFSTGGGLYVAVRQREIDGRLGICGAWTKTPQSLRSEPHNRDVLSAGVVSLGGERVLSNLTFLTPHPEGTRLRGRQAACVVTDRAWQTGDGEAALSVTLPRRSFDHDASGEGEAMAAVRFRQTRSVPEDIL